MKTHIPKCLVIYWWYPDWFNVLNCTRGKGVLYNIPLCGHCRSTSADVEYLRPCCIVLTESFVNQEMCHGSLIPLCSEVTQSYCKWFNVIVPRYNVNAENCLLSWNVYSRTSVIRTHINSNGLICNASLDVEISSCARKRPVCFVFTFLCKYPHISQETMKCRKHGV